MAVIEGVLSSLQFIIALLFNLIQINPLPDIEIATMMMMVNNGTLYFSDGV